MRSNRKLAIALLSISSAMFVGCGGGAEVKQTSVSQGQELADLKTALDQGAIDQANYEKLQKKILKRGY